MSRPPENAVAMRWIAIAVALLVLSSATACGGRPDAETYVDSNQSRESHSLVFSGSADDEGVSHLYVAGGKRWNVRRLAGAFDGFEWPLWSPTYDHLADESGIVMRSDGTGRRNLGVYLRPGFPWAPDGKRLVYSDDPYEEGPIFVVSASRSSPQRVANGSRAQWGPDGRIYYQHGSAIHALDVVSRRAVTVATASGWVLGYESWSPDGRRVAYDVGVEEHRSVYVLEPGSSTEPTALLADLDPPIVDINAYGWAPDGEHLAVIAGRDDSSAEPLGPGTYGIRWELHIVDVDDGSSEEVLDIEAHDLAWSPDGQWIALTRYWGFNRWRGSASDIWLVQPDGTGLRQVTDGRDPGKDWNHTTGTSYAHATWVPVAAVARRVG